MKNIHIWFLLAALSCLAHADDVSSLNAEYRQLLLNKIVTLRNFDSSTFQKYDKNGELEGKPSPGPWTLFSKFKVQRLTITNDKIVMSGVRIFVGFDRGTHDQRLLGSNETLQIEIKVPQPATRDGVNTSLSKLILHGGEAMADLAPDFWRSYFRPEANPSNSESKAENPDAPIVLRATPGKPILAERGSGGHLLKKVQPAYSEFARRFKQSGTVVLQVRIGKTGTISSVQIKYPAGFGLDEAAVEAVKQWKYEPYLREGKPVKIEFDVTVNFGVGQ